MKKVIIKNNKEEYEKIYNESPQNNKSLSISNIYFKIFPLILINIILLLYLIMENYANKKEIKELKELRDYLKNEILKDKNKIELNDDNNIILRNRKIQNESLTINNNTIDKDMIGLKYPEIFFDDIKEKIINNNLKSGLIKFLEELEIKLIYLEKEINATKVNAFYTARTLLLKERNIEYDDSNITELHHIVSWLIIHRSTQLKGIVSDKYLACKYVKMKLGIDLCPQRIGVYNSVDEIDFKKLIKLGNVILKISNGNHDSTYIFKNFKYDINILKKKVEYSFYRNFPLIDKVFTHYYSKKRIVLEKMFIPISDLYEFKYVILNNDIKVIYVRLMYKKKLQILYFDSNYNLLSNKNKNIINIFNFKKNILDKLKFYALKLSEDFPNFIRIDLYLFHDEIYLSELTFDHREGRPFLRDNKIIKEAGKNWKRIDCNDL